MTNLFAATLAVFIVALCLPAQNHSDSGGDPVKIAGSWQLTMDSPHGVLKGSFKVGQDGVKLTATYEADPIGTIQFTGAVQGTRVSFEMAGSDRSFKMTGTVDGDKMSGTTSMNDGWWKATRQ
jgi:hypothetical protein